MSSCLKCGFELMINSCINPKCNNYWVKLANEKREKIVRAVNASMI